MFKLRDNGMHVFLVIHVKVISHYTCIDRQRVPLKPNSVKTCYQTLSVANSFLYLKDTPELTIYNCTAITEYVSIHMPAGKRSYFSCATMLIHTLKEITSQTD